MHKIIFVKFSTPNITCTDLFFYWYYLSRDALHTLIKCSKSLGKGRPATSAAFGKRLCSVNQGIVFISNNMGPSEVIIISTLAYLLHPTALYAMSAIC